MQRLLMVQNSLLSTEQLLQQDIHTHFQSIFIYLKSKVETFYLDKKDFKIELIGVKNTTYSKKTFSYTKGIKAYD